MSVRVNTESSRGVSDRLSTEASRRITDGQPEAPGRFAVHSPIDGSMLAEVADCGSAQAKAAAEGAVRAFATWKTRTAVERAAVLHRWHDLILEHQYELARLMAAEMGKPVTEAKGEVQYAAAFVEWFAEEARRVYGDTIPSHVAHKRLTTLRQPTGVVYAITPWNFPAAMITRKVSPALAVGCTVIIKPAEQTPLTALYLATLWRDAGGPAGTLQVLSALDPVPVSQVLLDDERVRVLTFTGSTAVGIELYGRCAKTMKRVALELGGHAPFIVFADADLDAAVREVVACKFRNAGQTCVCTNRIYVDEDVREPFIQLLTQAVRDLRVGDPLDATTQIGPLVDQQGLSKVDSHVQDAVRKGAKPLVGGKAMEGLYYEPTVLDGVGPGMQLMREETFGPVAPVMTFQDEAEAVRLANDTPYGLAAYFWTRDLSRAHRVSEALEYGIVGVNDGIPSAVQAPFGGVKFSGLGREGGRLGLDEFLDVKYVSVALG